MGKNRFPEIKRGPNGEKRCRGCGGEIPKRRQTWCSNECYEKHEPGHVYHRIFKRADGKCEECGKDLKWPSQGQAEMHHIKPFSEGGETVDDNMICLCHDCHAKKTKEWHAQKKCKRKGYLNELPLFI